MATVEQLKVALVQAHRAGDTKAANLFASKIKATKNNAVLQLEQSIINNNDFIPTDENLAKPLPEQPEASLLDDRTW